MKTLDIKHELAEAIQRTGWQKNILAEAMHTTQSNVSNWLSYTRKGIPNQALIDLADILDDYRFRCVVAEKLTGVHILSQNHEFADQPQAQYFSSAKEEDDRKKLDPEITIILGKRREDRTNSDRKLVLNYLSELDQEIEEEHNYETSIMEDWGLSLN